MDKELKEIIESMNKRLSNIAYQLSFCRKLTREDQKKLRIIENELTNER